MRKHRMSVAPSACTSRLDVRSTLDSGHDSDGPEQFVPHKPTRAMRQRGASRLRPGGSAARMSFMGVAITLLMQGQHLADVRWPVSAPVEKAVIVVCVDMMSLDEPHEMDGVSAGGEAAVGLEYVVADRFGAGEALVADTDHAGTMFSCRYPVRHNER